MNKKQFLLFLLPCLVLIPVVLVLLLFPDGGEGHYPITGRYAETADGQHMIYRNTDTGKGRYVLLLPRDDDAMFDEFETGDAILVHSSPRWEEASADLWIATVYEPKKVRDLATIPKLTEEPLLLMENLALTPHRNTEKPPLGGFSL